MENTLIRSEPCGTCGAPMLWTQNAWPVDTHTSAAYRCPNQHVVDPDTTRQCPKCGVHDTHRVGAGETDFQCYRCSARFSVAG